MSEARALAPVQQTDPAIQRIADALAILGTRAPGVREMRTLILGLEAAILALPEHMTRDDFETTHEFAPGLYLRSVIIPKNCVLTGRIHKTHHICILRRGEVTVYTDQGMQRLKAPCTIHSLPGMKRVLLAHEESDWLNIHHNPTGESDPEKLLSMLTADTFEQAYLASARSFEEAIHYLGFSPCEMQAMSEHEADQIPLVEIMPTIEVRESPIHGKGIFALRSFNKGELIARARVHGKRTPAGRFCNHVGDPNAEVLMRENGDIDFIARSPIDVDTEITSDYYLNFTHSREGVSPCRR